MFFSLREYSENNENYIEVPLIFERVIREDLHTDFKCVVINTMSFQTLRTTVKEGMDLGHVRGESYMLNVPWMLNKAAGPPDGYLGGPVSFLWMEHTKQSSHFLWLFWESVAWLGEIILKRKFKVEANFWEKKIAMMLWLTEKKQNKTQTNPNQNPSQLPMSLWGSAWITGPTVLSWPLEEAGMPLSWGWKTSPSQNGGWGRT